MAEKFESSSRSFLQKELTLSRRLLMLAAFIMLLIFAWHSYLTINVHNEYQSSLMERVSSQVISEYQSHIESVRYDINQFQWNKQEQLRALIESGNNSTSKEYMALLGAMRDEIDEVRLFSVVNADGVGLFSHITGDFLADCEAEIKTTLARHSQEDLFLHRSDTSVHYDILEPIPGTDYFIFVAFNPTKLIDLLSDYRLPQQELFLLRKDLIGKVELSTVKEIQERALSGVIMTEKDVESFSFVKPIPRTRWQVSIRLDKAYQNQLLVDTLVRSITVWFIIVGILWLSFLSKRKRLMAEYRILQKLEFKELHDNLTGLINRATYTRKLDDFLSSIAPDKGVAILIDIDRFQVFNNLIGFTKGDECLKLIAIQLSSDLNDGEHSRGYLSRVSNDQFAVLLPELAHREAESVSELIRCRIAGLDLSAISEDLSLTCCIGTIRLNNAFYDGEHIMSALLSAVKLAKDKGRNRTQLYQSSDHELVNHANEMSIVKALKTAILEDQFVLYRQLLKPVETNDHYKGTEVYEVLLRLFDKQGQLISPEVFIPIAEEHGIAVDIDKWVIENSLRKMSEHQSAHRYCINLSGQSLADDTMTDFVKNAIEQHQVQPHRVTLEITETFAITHLEKAKEFIDELTKFGCNFALDDFGSGLSSFRYLQDLPVQKLKIDGVFIQSIDTSERNRAFVKTMVELAQSMDMETVAEFVETQSQYELLCELNIDYCQGYLFDKPSQW